jgi:hypothetical protein
VKGEGREVTCFSCDDFCRVCSKLIIFTLFSSRSFLVMRSDSCMVHVWGEGDGDSQLRRVRSREYGNCEGEE